MISRLSTTSRPFLCSTLPLYLPCVESYLNMYTCSRQSGVLVVGCRVSSPRHPTVGKLFRRFCVASRSLLDSSWNPLPTQVPRLLSLPPSLPPLTMYSGSMNGSFTATTLTPFSMQTRSTRRPMRPNLSNQEHKGKGMGVRTRVTGMSWYQCPTKVHVEL